MLIVTNRMPAKCRGRIFDMEREVFKGQETIMEFDVFNFLNYPNYQTLNLIADAVRVKDLTKIIIVDFTRFRQVYYNADLVFESDIIIDAKNQLTGVELEPPKAKKKVKPIFVSL